MVYFWIERLVYFSVEINRIENRTCSVYSNLTHLQNKDKWVGLKTIVRIQTQVINKSTGKISNEQRAANLYIKLNY